MGNKVSPIGLRIGITKTWQSQWFAGRGYRDALHQDRKIREFLGKKLGKQAALAKVEIMRSPKEVRAILHTARPGVIIGRGGVGITDLRREIAKLLPPATKFTLDIMEIKKPELVAELVAQSVASQIEKRIAHRRAMKQALARVMDAGAKGVKIQLSGRLGGAEIARREVVKDGSIPGNRLSADIDYAQVDALTTYGVVGIKVWIYAGEKPAEEQQS